MKWLIVLATVLLGSATYAGQMHNGYEIPDYSVISQDGDIELRTYPDHLVAEYVTSGSRKRAVGQGFRALAGYIFGKNATAEKISMTAPVTQFKEDNRWHIRFMVPSDKSLAALPTPDNTAVKLHEVEGRTQLVIRFSGLWRDTTIEAKIKTLQDYAQANGMELLGEPIIYYYDDPMTLPWKRRNEVAFETRSPSS